MGACLPLLIEEINDISDKSNFLCPVSPWIGTPDFFVSPYIKLKRNSIGNRYPRTRFPGELCMEYRNPGPAWILYPLPTRRLYATTINSKHLCEGSRVLGKGDLFLCQRLGGKESLIPWQRVAECPALSAHQCICCVPTKRLTCEVANRIRKEDHRFPNR